MIDSGSQGNVIKIGVLPHNIKINYCEKIWIKGISNEPFITTGSVDLKMFNQTIRFHVIQDTTQIPYSGILGIDFLQGNEVIIDFKDKNLHSKNHTMRFKQNGDSNKGKEINGTLSGAYPTIYRCSEPKINLHRTIFVGHRIGRKSNKNKFLAT